MSKPITLYDIPGTTETIAWSLNTWKTRFLFNMKNIPHKTVWVEYPDIQSTLSSIGMPPSYILQNGPFYTVPAISDPNPGNDPILVSESWKIAEYLDEKYPNHPLFPNGTKSLQYAFNRIFQDVMKDPIILLVVQLTHRQLNPASHEFFRRTREKNEGKKLEEFCLEGEERDAAIEEARQGFDRVAKWFDTTKGKESEGMFIIDGQIVYADLILGAFLKWIKVVAHDELWTAVCKWNDGRWERFLHALEEKYGTVQ